MSNTCRVALLGFSDFERSALASYLRLADRGDAGLRASSRRRRQPTRDRRRRPRAVGAAGCGWPTGRRRRSSSAPRPRPARWPGRCGRSTRCRSSANSTRCRAAGRRRTGAAGPGDRPPRRPQGRPPRLQRGSAAPRRRHSRGPPPRRRPAPCWSTTARSRCASCETPVAALGPARRDASTASDRALELLAGASYDFVFLDVDLGPHSELDGLALCQHIKRQPATRRPRRRGGDGLGAAGQLDRMRGSLAGCDAYLAKPLDAGAKLASRAALVARAGPAARAEVPAWPPAVRRPEAAPPPARPSGRCVRTDAARARRQQRRADDQRRRRAAARGVERAGAQRQRRARWRTAPR